MRQYQLNSFSESIRRSFFRKVYIAVILFLSAILTGIIGFMLIERFDFIEALYMTIITISTVGFTEVRPLSNGGRLFTSVLILSNIGILAYFVSIITSILMEDEFREVFQSYRIKKQIRKLENHVVVCGYGRLGRQVIEELNLEGQSFITIDEKAIKMASADSDRQRYFIEGDATKEETLKRASLEVASALITTLPQDAENVFVILTARQINPKLKIISRAAAESSISKIKQAGADHVIMPEHLGGAHMAKLITKPDMVDFINEVSGQSGVNIYFEECSFENLPDELRDKSIRELDVKKKTGANIIGIRNPDGTFTVNPHADTHITSYSKLILLGSKDQLDRFNEFMNRHQET